MTLVLHKGDLQLILVCVFGTTIWQLSKINEKDPMKPKQNESFWMKEASAFRGAQNRPPFKNEQRNTIYINESKLFALILHSKLESESKYDVVLNDVLNRLLKSNGVKNRLHFDATVSCERYHSEDQYGAHRSKDGATISLVDKSLAD